MLTQIRPAQIGVPRDRDGSCEPVIRDWREVYEPLPDDRLHLQAGRWTDCGGPFCHQG